MGSKLTKQTWPPVRAEGDALVGIQLADERFTRCYDLVPGLAQFVHDIVVASINR